MARYRSRLVESLKKVKLFNRTDCCNTGLTDLSVFVSDSPFPSVDPAVLAANPAVSEFALGATPLGRVTNVGINRTGRYVRVQMVGTGVLQLAEVEVIRASLADVVIPSATMTSPTEGGTVPAGAVTLSGMASDNVKVKRIALSLKNRTTNQYLDKNGNWGGYKQLPVASNKSTTTPWNVNVTLPAGDYRVVFRAVDTSGNKGPAVTRNFTVN